MTRLLETGMRLAKEHLTKYWTQLDVPIHFSCEKTQVASGVPHLLFNFVLRTNLSSAIAAKRIEETLRQFEKMNLPFCWVSDDDCRPANLNELLAAYGLEEAERMSLLLFETEAHPQGREERHIFAVSSKEMMQEWAGVIREGYGISEKEAKRYAELLTIGEIKPFRHFIYKKEGRASGAATLFFLPEIAGIYNLAAVSEADEKEIYTAIVIHLAAHARRIRRRFLCLHLPIKKAEWLRPLGFEEIGNYSLYSALKRSST